MDPAVHAESSAKKFGGVAVDYIKIHVFIDSAKSAAGTQRHRVFTHNIWFANTVVPAAFGDTITNSAGEAISVRDIALQHIGEDFGREDNIPTLDDIIKSVFRKKLPKWLNNGCRNHGDEGLVPHLQTFEYEGESDDGADKGRRGGGVVFLPHRPIRYD